MKKYKALPNESEIDPEVALLQGVLALDAAGVMAETMNDVTGMLNVAAGWMRLAEVIGGVAQHMEEQQEKAIGNTIVKSKSAKIDIGFCVTDEAEDDDDGTE